MKKIISTMILLIFFSCEKEETTFIQSKAIGNLFLLKNPPKNDSLVRNTIINFLRNDHRIKNRQNDFPVYIYKLTSNTELFLKDERPGGYFREYLDNYPDDEVATFITSKCKQDSSKIIKELYYYGLQGSNEGQKEIDTLIYQCK